MYRWTSNDWRIDSKNPYVKAERSVVQQEGVTLFPVTELDDILRGMSHSGHTLSKEGSWESFPEKVEGLAISRSITYHHFYRQHTVAYDVPVSGHLISVKDEAKQPAIQGSFMRWNGKLYDRNKLYTMHADSGAPVLKEYGPLVISPPTFPDPKISRLNASFRDYAKSFAVGHGFRLIHGHSNIAHRHPSEAVAGSKGLLIDLHRPMCVSHIGTMGGVPHASVFPNMPSSARPAWWGRAKGGDKRRYRKLKKARNGHVYVVSEPVSPSLSSSSFCFAVPCCLLQPACWQFPSALISVLSFF